MTNSNLNLLLNSGERALCPGTVGSPPWYQLSSPSQVAFLFFAVCWHHITHYHAIKIFIYQLSHICLPVVELLSLNSGPRFPAVTRWVSLDHVDTLWHFFLLTHSVLLQSAALSLLLEMLQRFLQAPSEGMSVGGEATAVQIRIN